MAGCAGPDSAAQTALALSARSFYSAGMRVRPMGMERAAPAEESTAAELARRTAMLSAIGDASAAIVAAADWRRAIGDMLEGIGRGAEASRASLFEVHTGPGGFPVQSCRFDWAEPPWEPMASNPAFHDMSLSDDPERPGDIGRWSQRRQRGEVVQATLTRGDRPHSRCLCRGGIPVLHFGSGHGLRPLVGFHRLRRLQEPAGMEPGRSRCAQDGGRPRRQRHRAPAGPRRSGEANRDDGRGQRGSGEDRGARGLAA